MKVLVVNGNYHHKNKKGFDMICKHLNIECRFTNRYEKGYDVVYSVSKGCDNFPIPKIYGPGFGTFPTRQALSLKKGIYIQPSDWARESWNKLKNIPIYSFPFPVETERFKEVKPINERKEITVYFKHRDGHELKFLQDFLKGKNINYNLFRYGKYKEENYLNHLQNSKYMIVLGGHESQGFALGEALSTNVPLLVWSVKSMKQERAGFKYDDIPATTIPYWDERCGEFFHNPEELESTFDKFISKLETYRPRDYILENLSVEKCSERFLQLIEKAKENN